MVAQQGNVTPERDETPAVAAARGSEDQGQHAGFDCGDRSAVEQADKAFATLRARLALVGFQLHVTSADRGQAEYIVTRWNLSRTLPNMAGVQAFADRVGGLDYA